ncbi:MAG: hypothetical protein ACI379_07975 [Nocardioides sp.]|uniref:hypothetical protein n=1 Tax=Nocardioides sp. TaxID=35761 RepID=UPI003EFED0AD
MSSDEPTAASEPAPIAERPWPALLGAAALVALTLCPAVYWALQQSSTGYVVAAMAAGAVWAFALGWVLRLVGLRDGEGLALNTFAVFVVAAPVAALVFAALPSRGAIAVAAGCVALPVASLAGVALVRWCTTSTQSRGLGILLSVLALLAGTGLSGWAGERVERLEVNARWLAQLEDSRLDAYLPEVDDRSPRLTSLMRQGGETVEYTLTYGRFPHSFSVSAVPTSEARCVPGAGTSDECTQEGDAYVSRVYEVVEVDRGGTVLVGSLAEEGPDAEELARALLAAERVEFSDVVATR